MQISGSREREENLQFLRSAPFLQELEESLLCKVVDLLQRVSRLVILYTHAYRFFTDND